jgi:hypothetical protein
MFEMRRQRPFGISRGRGADDFVRVLLAIAAAALFGGRHAHRAVRRDSAVHA